jgi:hypothetical protein
VAKIVKAEPAQIIIHEAARGRLDVMTECQL